MGWRWSTSFQARQEDRLLYIEIAALLARERERSPEYLGPSFGPISGWAEHGALPHYSATEESNATVEGDGLLVLDTGGHYQSGMTDVTRTILFGVPTEEQKRDYTLVLKGNLALASARFPEGTCGYQLDVLARQFLWQEGLAFHHGTGHGIGFRLNVHEGPQSISPKPLAVPLKKGMIVSDEPGLYREGKHGIRIENVVAVQEDGRSEFGTFLSFEVLTICPFERTLITRELLSEAEVAMVDAYTDGSTRSSRIWWTRLRWPTLRQPPPSEEGAYQHGNSIEDGKIPAVRSSSSSWMAWASVTQGGRRVAAAMTGNLTSSTKPILDEAEGPMASPSGFPVTTIWQRGRPQRHRLRPCLQPRGEARQQLDRGAGRCSPERSGKAVQHQGA